MSATGQVDSSTVFFNPLQDGYLDDPFPHLAELRAADPVHKALTGQWVLFRHEDVARLLRDPSLSVDDDNIDPRHADPQRMATFEEAFADQRRTRSMLGLDAPDHNRLRRLVSKAFTPSAIEALRPLVERLVDDTLDRVAEAGSTEVISDLAFPLPFDVISEMLGMPDADTADIARWSGALVKTLDPIITDDEIREAAAAERAMTALISEVIEWKRANPTDDLLTALIAAEEDGDRLTADELADQVQLLFVAGHETTVNLIGTGLYELLRRPEQAAALRDDPDLDVLATDELLRFVSPVQLTRRIALDDLEIGGVAIPKGSFVLASLAAANHDPERWGPTADDLDVSRADAGQHVSFGGGSHYCLGASLAKLEAQIAIGRFVRRFPNASLDGDIEWNGRINLRGLERFPLTV